MDNVSITMPDWKSRALENQLYYSISDITDEEGKEADKDIEERINRTIESKGIATRTQVARIVNDVKRKLKREFRKMDSIADEKEKQQAQKEIWDSIFTDQTTELFNKLFSTFVVDGKAECQAIASMDSMKWQVGRNKGTTIYEYHNPLSYLADIAYELEESDVKEYNRYIYQKKRGKQSWSLDKEDEDGRKYEIEEKDFYVLDMDVRLQNYKYLTDKQKYIWAQIVKGFYKSEIAKQLSMSPQEFRTEIKHMAATLTNPPSKELLEQKKTCSCCKQSKPIIEFARDRSRKDNFSHRCKECDRKRKQTKKFGGNSTKIA
ncbi:MAG: hypothetical protein IJI39_09035 [Clostridia bacterium]|nr:hypothetical protein [Clostridia bacterium]